MRVAVVTGAGGFLAGHVGRLLLDAGWAVRGVVRPGSASAGHVPPGVEAVPGDLRAPATMTRACDGADAVFHIAAAYSLARRRGRALRAENLAATRAVLAACRARDLPLVHTSSVATVGLPAPPGRGDERTPLPAAQVVGAYKRSKVETEREVLAAARDGLHAVVVNPTAPVGPGDWRPTPTGRLIRDSARGRMPATVDTGLSVLHVEDAARGHLLALESGVAGRRYVLGGENLTLDQIVSISCRAAGRRPPRVRIPHALAVAVASVDEAVEGWALGREPAAPLDGALMARKRMWVSDERARRELGHASRPAAQAIREAVAWFEGDRAAERAAGAIG